MADTKLEIIVPEGVEVDIKGDFIVAKSDKGEVTRKFPENKIKITKKDNIISLEVPTEKRRQLALLGTYRGHVNNMMKGVTEGVSYKMKIVYSHFPMTVKAQGDTIVIDNFLGERYPRKTKILKDVSVAIKGQDITITGIDKENVAQTAANLEQVTKIKKLDPRVFQDGIYIIEKDGKEII